MAAELTGVSSPLEGNWTASDRGLPAVQALANHTRLFADAGFILRNCRPIDRTS